MSDETKHMSKYARKVAARLKAQQAVSETFAAIDLAVRITEGKTQPQPKQKKPKQPPPEPRGQIGSLGDRPERLGKLLAEAAASLRAAEALAEETLALSKADCSRPSRVPSSAFSWRRRRRSRRWPDAPRRSSTRKERPMESLSDIEEELRDLSRSAKYCELQPTVNGMTISAYFANLADRIAAIDSADAWRSLYTPGNAAAMREALERFMGWYNITSIRTASLRTIAEAARAALAAPPRNCDKMPYLVDLTMHDLANSPCKSTLECASREELLALVRWLLAPAAEREGEGDENN